CHPKGRRRSWLHRNSSRSTASASRPSPTPPRAVCRCGKNRTARSIRVEGRLPTPPPSAPPPDVIANRAFLACPSGRSETPATCEGDDAPRAGKVGRSRSRPNSDIQRPERGIRFATDSPAEGDGFEPVWGLFCQVVISAFSRYLVRSGKAVLRPV